MLGIGRPIFDKSEKIALGTPRHPRGTPRGPKMPSNATWFRQHVPKCRQMRHGFDNKFQNAPKCDMVSTTCSKPTKPTNLPTYIYIYIYFLCMHNTLVHAQHSCACTGGARAQGRDPNKKQPRVRAGAMHKNLVHAQESSA